ncbi:F-box/kelch-repeat protein [Hibiscus syriacus]|uniref:F-box/kelch-repeat protein n=1 Tax=Hibiscus syriacus TaxID=106335 RepID=A0A6A2XYC8_HIBSY|nr:F-box/kelch-repeat protein [Hibiscus syriacus]
MQRVRLSSQQAPVHKLGDSQMTLSPKFRLAVVPSSLLNPSSEYESSLQGEPVIPGLPNDVALNCLLSLSVQNLAACKVVCKRWHLLLGNKERFFTQRKELVEIVLSSTQPEVLDPPKGCWDPIASMGTNMASYDSAVLNGKLLVTNGWLWPFFVSPRGQVYDPRTNNWECMAVGSREGWTGSIVVVYGHLFVVSELKRMKLKVYDPGSDSWEVIEGPPLPEHICKPFAVSSCDNRIYVVSCNLHVAVGYISSLNQTSSSEKWGFDGMLSTPRNVYLT